MSGAFYMPVVSVACCFCRFGCRIGVTGVGIKHWGSDVPVFMEYLCILVLELGIFTLLLFLHKSTESYG